MKIKSLNVPVEIIREFSEIIADKEITNEILGVTGEGEIIVEVRYEKEERQAIYELMELIEDHLEEEED